MKCLDCKKRLRPYGVTKDQAPGTLAHAGRSLCHKCYGVHRANGFEGYPVLGAEDLAPTNHAPAPITPKEAAAGLGSFLNRRRARLSRHNPQAARRTVWAAHPDPTTGLWALTKNGVTIGLAPNEPTAYDHLRALAQPAAHAA